MAADDPGDGLSFPRRYARSQRFTLGRPRTFAVAAGGARMLYLRSDAGDDPLHHLWVLDLENGTERRLVDARTLGAQLDALPAEERARRERAREAGGGIVAYATDRTVRHAAFAVGGQVWTVAVDTGQTREVPVDGAAFDVRLSPDGDRLAAVVDGTLHVGDVGGALAPLVAEEGVRWAVADFVAAEEMQRQRGYWWAPDSSALLACRVDDRDVPVWTIADPAHPGRPATQHRYPAAGTTNPAVTLWHVDAVTGDRHEVVWDRQRYPYLAVVTWSEEGPPLLLVQQRDQSTSQVLVVGPDGATRVAREDRDDVWVEIVPGVPAWSGSRLVTVADLADHGVDGSRALLVDGAPISPPGMQVRRVIAVTAEEAWVTASTDDPTVIHVHRVDLDDGHTVAVTSEPGVHDASVRDGTAVVVSATLDRPAQAEVHLATGDRRLVPAAPLAPGLRPEVELLRLGPQQLAGALLRPAGDGPWPVLLDPYGGPHAQRVVQSQAAYYVSAWFAAQGYAVLVVDGRGTPGRGPAFERAVRGNLADPPLDDQVDGLMAAAALEPRLDLARVAIRGWSFGGYLAALACLRRPDVFRAGIVGAPVTDWHLYDTHYTERYLGHPDEQPDAYRRSSLVDRDGVLVDPAPLTDPADGPQLLVIHGLADDNVVAAHSLRLSSGLLAAGRPHRFLPLSGVTHMTPQEVVAENLLLVQRDFLDEVLAPPDQRP